MKVFILALLVLNLMCFALGDKDQKSDFVDLDAADGDALPQVEDYVEDEEDPNVSRSQLLNLFLISQNVKVKLIAPVFARADYKLNSLEKNTAPGVSYEWFSRTTQKCKAEVKVMDIVIWSFKSLFKRFITQICKIMKLS